MMNYIFHDKKPDNYKGFVYLVTIHHDKPMNKYGGSKEGEFDYNYEGSPETNKEIYFEDLGKYDSTMEVWFKELYRDACTSEGKMLRESNAANSKEWYNASNVSGHVTTGVNPHLPSIVEGFQNEDFRIEVIPKEDIDAIPCWQIRRKEVEGHVASLANQMYDRGQLFFDDKEPIAILEDFYGKGKHLRIGGWHNTKAAMSVAKITELRVQFCPKSIWKKLLNNIPKDKDKNHFIKTLAMSLNPPIKDPRVPASDEEWVDWIVERYSDLGIEADSEANKDYLVNVVGYTKRFVSNSLVVKAKTRIKNEELIPMGETINMWDEEPLLSELNQKISSKTTPTSGAFPFRTGMPKSLWPTLIEAITVSPEKKDWTIFDWHPSASTKETWEKTWQSPYRRKLDTLEKNWKTPIKFHFAPLEFTRVDEIEEPEEEVDND